MVSAEIDELDPAKICVITAFKHSEMIKSIPGSRWEKDRRVWRIPLSWPGCLALRGVFGAELEVGPNLSRWATSELETRVNPSMALREQLAAELYPDLYPHQNADVLFLSTAERAILGNEPGVGKSAAAIRSMLRVFETGGNPFPALIVAPNSMKMTWKREFETWWPGVDVSVVKGTAVQRRKALERKSHCYVLNWESLRSHSRLAPYGSTALIRCKECGGTEDITPARCEVHLRELNGIPFATVIADEAHRAKNPSAKQARALWAATGDARYRFGLTGTPIANNPGDLWSLLHWVDPAGYPSKIKFQNRYLDLMYNGFGGLMISGLKASTSDEFFKGFDPRFRRMTKKVVLPFLPEVVQETRYVEMTPKQAKAYKQMQEKMLAELDDGSLVVAPNSLTRIGRLLQFASSFGELTEPDLEGHQNLILSEPSSKISAFLDDLPDFEDEAIVVFAQSKQLINLLSARLEKLGIDHGMITGDQSEDERQHDMDRFQAGKINLMLCTIQAGGVGITLTAASMAVFLQRSWSRVDMEQAVNRVHRIGSEKHDHITILNYVAPDTAELAVLQALETKGERFEEVVRDGDLLRKLLTDGTL